MKIFRSLSNYLQFHAARYAKLSPAERQQCRTLTAARKVLFGDKPKSFAGNKGWIGHKDFGKRKGHQ